MTKPEWGHEPGTAGPSRLRRRALLHTAAAIGALALTGWQVTGRVRADANDDTASISPDTLQAATDDYALEATDPLAASLNPPQRAASVAANSTPDGASGANIAYVQGQTANWFIEEQRNARDAIVGGLVVSDHDAIAAGFRMIAWGAARQAADGSFAGTRDAFHSTSFFVEATAHALLCTLGSPHAERYASEVAHYTPMLARAAGWMITPEVWEPGVRANTPYTHRRYIVAAALGLTMRLTGDDAPRARMEESLADGLALQGADGNNPEKGAQTAVITWWASATPSGGRPTAPMTRSRPMCTR